MNFRHFLVFALLFFTYQIAFCDEVFPNYAEIYLGKDKFENFNRKVFLFNGALNKYAIKPITVVWSSIMPKYGQERLKNAYQNILYPRILVSSLIQKDFEAVKKATTRFLVNSTLGVAGMFDVSKKILKIKPIEEDMEQALAKLKIKKGPYLVVPILSSTTVRGLFGKGLDASLDPTSYIGNPVIAGVKAGLTVNNLTLIQPLSNLVEKNYIDPYDIAKKMYGVQVAILENNLDREEIIELKEKEINEENEFKNLAQNSGFINVSNNLEDIIKGSTFEDNIFSDELPIDIILKNYNPQHPVIDSMRTALFDIEGVDDSIWGENSIWNRSFKNRIKLDKVLIYPDREKYKFRYIMQKDKNSPVAIIFPSIGEGINSHHSNIMAKIFYDEGYSVIIQGSAFHYDFAKSMEKGYVPGNPNDDVKYIKETTAKILEKLEEKYDCKFRDKVVLGTSYGAMSSLFLADYEARNNTLNISKFISINPPIELLYAMSVIDENNKDWDKNPNNLKEKTSLCVAKVLNTIQKKEENFKIETLPFNLVEAKLITGFVLHQKLSDLIFALEDVPIHKKTDFYEKMNKISYKDYANKYLLSKNYPNLEEFSIISSLHYIKNYLQNGQNYRIYHTIDDYLVNYEQLKKLKSYSKEKMKLIDKGAHLGFLYREEFINDLRKEISLKNKPRL